jgi:hypothetical protein
MTDIVLGVGAGIAVAMAVSIIFDILIELVDRWRR